MGDQTSGHDNCFDVYNDDDVDYAKVEVEPGDIHI